MKVSTEQIVRRTIRHADRMAQRTGYEWPAARGALMKIVADLERRSPGDASVERLREYIAERDRECAERNSPS